MNLKKSKNKIKKTLKNGTLIKYYKNLEVDEKLIFLESKSGRDIGGNIFYILKELSKKEYGDYKVVLSLKKNLFEIKEELLKNYGINNVNFTISGSLDYYKYLYSSKYLFNDATFPPTFIKKENQIYINVWHGTPIKKLGKFNAKRGYGLGNVQRNFLMADYLLYPNRYMEEKMLDSFMLRNLSKGKIINEGYPRNNVFFDEKNSIEELKNELELTDKEIIAYMPTWRGIYSNLDIEGQNNTIKNYLSEIDKKLSKNQVLFVNLHTVVEDLINYNDYNNIKPFPKNKEVYDFLKIVDCLITDYSSIFFDFASSRKKIILFTYDEEEYLNEVGLYFPLDELPFPKTYNTEDLIQEINTPKKYDDNEFIKKFCEFDRKEATEILCENLILNYNNLKSRSDSNLNFKGNKSKSNLKIKSIDSNDRKNILVFVGSLKDSKITENLKTMLKSLDLNKRNYFLTFRESDVKNNQKTLYELSKQVDYIPMKDYITLSFIDNIFFKLFFKFEISNNMIKNRLDKIYEFNILKYFVESDFDIIIQFTGFNKQITSLFQRFKAKKAIFMQKNMEKEICQGSEDKLVLKNAYDNYDCVFLMDNDLLELKMNLSPKKDNIIVLNDFNDLNNF